MIEDLPTKSIETNAADASATAIGAKSINENVKQRKEFSIEIFRIIRNAQKQHGLRHGDYQRYRGM